MGPKDAIKLAKDYVTDLFAADGAMNIGLEELRFDPETTRSLVTIGFSRAWDGPQGMSRWTNENGTPWPRTFKTVEIADGDGRVLELKHWPVAA